MTRKILEALVQWTKLKYKIQTRVGISPLYFKEREIWWVTLGKNIGHEQHGKNDTFEISVLIFKKFNKDLTWVIPLTDSHKDGLYYVPLEYHGKKYSAMVSQLRALSSKRLLRKIGTLAMDDDNLVRQRVKSLI